ncbi:serine/arginine repetitive matrix protein 2 isoform X1 [Sander lucioperca]|uniref:serine/arginine repetitive matrix protein 2 isoform X1 n=1 Tax=Sander lucioperca TaxID=283035 RepID=UPI00125D6BFE|nr:serine/arginine repetitive matrix protein 2 isoform X1 [Sander lucioperca]
MATVQCPNCTAERKGFRRELDSWRHKLIHCVGFESILEGIYGTLLLRDLNLFDDCEPEEVDDWSPETSCSQCSFCNLPLDKLSSDQVPAATSPLSSPSDYSPCQAPALSESSQSAHRFLQAVFNKKDVSPGCDSNIPRVAQELMKKMIHQFALEYASKCLLHTSTNGVTTRTSSPLSETSDAPLDLTVSRTGEEKESESDPDGVLDLSNRNSACLATSSTSSNHKASGSQLLSSMEESGDLEQRGTKCRQSSALGVVLSSLCSAHHSLLYQILKLARQEKLLLFLNHRPVDQTESHCCHCGVNPQDIVTPNAVSFSECKANNSSPYYPLIDCDHQGHGSIMYHPGDPKSNCSIHHYPLTDCKSDAPLGSSYCCVQRCRMETYTVMCPKRLHCISCQSLAVGHINNRVCSFASSPSLSKSPSRCTPSSSLCPSSSICYNQHNPLSCPCYLNHACLTQVRNTKERGVGDGDPPCPVLTREQSPSPPPLSPITSDINKKTDEKPPSLLHHRQEVEADQMVKDGLVNASHQEADVDTTTEVERECRTPKSSPAEQNPSGTSLQDVVNRFSEKLETIRPIEKDPPPAVSTAVNVSEKDQPQCPSTSQNLQFQVDAHLTEIITTVLHTGSASDYNLSELFNRHDSKEPKSPNTRSRRRQEVLTAIATPADDASTRRQTLQIKRELAMFDQSYSRRKVPLAKRARLKDGNITVSTSPTSSDSNLVKEESKREMEVGVDPVENHRVSEGPLNILTAESNRDEVKEEIQTVIVTEEVQIIKAEEKEREISSEEKDLTLASTQKLTPELQSKYGKQGSKGNSVQTQVMTVTATSAKRCSSPRKEDGGGAGSDRNLEEAPSGQSSDNRPGKGKNCYSPIRDRQKCQSHHSKDARRSRRNIVPPQWFSSYVTEPRFYVGCFSESIFNQGMQKHKVLTSSTLDALSKDPDAEDTKLESRSSPEHTLKFPFESTHKEQYGPSYTESKGLSTNQVFPQTLADKEKSPTKQSPDNRTDVSDCAAKPFGRLRSSPKRLLDSKTTSRNPQNPSNMDVTMKSATCVESPPNSQVQYISPIKLMFVSPVKDKEGVRYSLKSASSGSSAQEPFDPCVESSWSGTLKKPKSQRTKSATSQVKSFSSPLKSATSPARSTSSPAKSAPSSIKSASSSPKSVSSSPKSASSPAKSASSPTKSASSPAKSPSSPKSASSPAKSASSSPKSASSPAKSPSSSPKSASSPAKSASSSPKSASSPAKSPSSSPKSASSPAKSPSSSPKSASSPAKSPSSSPKSASSPAKSASSSPKSASSPAKSASSPKSASTSPKIGSRRSGDGTPTKRGAGAESQKSLGDSISFQETTPKRRPGRPKKLGPQLEQKAKRPIGRPRKEKALDSVMGAKTVNGKSVIASDVKDNVNRNLKITVVYGRSRRNKRMVSEGFDQLQTEFHACQAVGLKSDLGILMHNPKTSSGSIKTASTELSEELHFVSPVKEAAPQSSSNIKCQKRDDSAPSRKPGRPAKVKISGISVTVTTVSPRQRRIQINKDIRRSPETLIHKKVVLPEFKSAKEPWTISCQSTSKSSQTEEGIETEGESKGKLPNQPVAVRHSMRVRKPSIHLLHAVATSTSRSYSHSNALLRRSKQLLLNKASNERRQGEQKSSLETSREKRLLCGQESKKISQDLSRVAEVSIDSIFTPKDTLRWWAASAEENTMNQELARRIRLISDTWVSNTVENQEKETAFNSKIGTKGNSSFTRNSKQSSVVRTLFDCPLNKPRSCSMPQLCSWFMQTTETQSLAIVKKASSRNPYEFMHFPRSAIKTSVCHSPQAERLRKHIKKFAKTVPKSPLQHQQAQRRLRKRTEALLSVHKIRRQLFTPRFATSRLNQGAQWWRSRAFDKYRTTLFRARTRFLTRKERERLRKRQRNKKNIKVATTCSKEHVVTGLQPKRKALRRSAKDQLTDRMENSSATSSVDQTQEPMDVQKEQNLCCKAWSPETLKECRVFLRKINSPDNESTEEEWDSCTVTLDDGSPSAYLFAGRERELVGVVKAVKTERKMSTTSRELAGSAPKSVQEQDEMSVGRQKGKYKSPGVVSTEPPQPPPAKMLRQSRMRGLTGPRWCDFVLEN